jgi:bacteriorhodopsin
MPPSNHLTFENFFSYGPAQYDIVDHFLTLGYAAMAAGFVYFLVTLPQLAPRYKLSSVLGAVVMASAFFELFELSALWNTAFVFDPLTATYVLGTESAFSNGFRYTNWSIDVPVLLTQLLVIAGVSGKAFRSMWVQFIVAGILMIYTGYAGQFYEAPNGGPPTTPFWVWGAVSTVFFVWIIWIAYRATYGQVQNMPEPSRGPMKAVFWLLVISWMLYPGGYLMPAMWPAADGVVARQITYTIADISSKVIYGVLLSYVGQVASAATGYEPAQRWMIGNTRTSTAPIMETATETVRHSETVAS